MTDAHRRPRPTTGVLHTRVVGVTWALHARSPVATRAPNSRQPPSTKYTTLPVVLGTGAVQYM